MTKMDQGMAITYSGDADKDFAAGMLAHHQGAIDMAQVENLERIRNSGSWHGIIAAQRRRSR